MASFDDVYIINKQFVEFFKEATSLVDRQALRVGQKYSWPVKYNNLYNNGILTDALVEILSGTGFSYSVNASVIEIIL